MLPVLDVPVRADDESASVGVTPHRNPYRASLPHPCRSIGCGSLSKLVTERLSHVVPSCAEVLESSRPVDDGCVILQSQSGLRSVGWSCSQVSYPEPEEQGWEESDPERASELRSGLHRGVHPSLR